VTLAARVLVALLAAAPAAGAPAPLVERDVAVPMRDGVRLQADVHRPAGTGRFPTLVYRTPYGRKHTEGNDVVRAALGRGYAVVLVDVRGRYGSGGVFVPYVNEGRDGYDTIEWAAGQPWSTGEIGTFGLSYPGAVQWLAAVESPPHLKAMVPAMTFSTPRNFFYAGGTWDLSWIAWIWENIAPDARARANLPGPRTGKDAEAAWESLQGTLPYRLPLTDIPEFQGGVAPYYFDWLAHRPGDAYWDWAELPGRYDRVAAAVLNFSGWHDETYGPEGAITNFLGLLAARQLEKDPRTQLVMGPWTHGGEDSDRSGDRVFGPSAPIDYAAMILRFMDRYVRGLDNGVDREPRVRAFVMGENAWRTGDTMPLPGTQSLSLYLAPGGKLTSRPPDPLASGPSSTSFVSDPAKPVTDPYGTQPGAHDYRELARRKDVLVFETEPLEGPLRVVGPIGVEMHLSADAPDADLWVLLEDVAPDGTAWNLSSPGTDVLRASDREGGPAPKPLTPGEVVVLRLPNLRTGNLFGKGHRVRVVLAGSFMPHFSRNLQTGESEARSAKTRPATLKIHHDAAHPSRLVLPVVP